MENVNKGGRNSRCPYNTLDWRSNNYSWRLRCKQSKSITIKVELKSVKVLETYIYLDQFQTGTNLSVLFEVPAAINI
jgi:hypothetical protein